MLGIVVFGVSPLGRVLFYALESRFPAWNATGAAPTGFIILGGSIDPDISAAHGEVALTDAAERLTVVADLANDIRARASSSPAATPAVGRDGLKPTMSPSCSPASASRRGGSRLKRRSRNTLENAQFTKIQAAPKPGDRWVMITSAYHMPRAMAAFRNVGFDVEAFPVDWQLATASDLYWPFRSLIGGIAMTDTAAREFSGLRSIG